LTTTIVSEYTVIHPRQSKPTFLTGTSRASREISPPKTACQAVLLLLVANLVVLLEQVMTKVAGKIAPHGVDVVGVVLRVV
jgi:hypothetical protein